MAQLVLLVVKHTELVLVVDTLDGRIGILEAGGGYGAGKIQLEEFC